MTKKPNDMDEQQVNAGAQEPDQEKLNAWIKKQGDGAVRKLMKQVTIDSLIVEAKPSWVLPFQILIGKVRAQGVSTSFRWYICGEVPTDFIASSVASTPRDVARHFAMKWQLAAAKYYEVHGKDSAVTEAEKLQAKGVENLVSHAEGLYGLVEDDRLWSPETNF